jgi:hypothetical protein
VLGNPEKDPAGALDPVWTPGADAASAEDPVEPPGVADSLQATGGPPVIAGNRTWSGEWYQEPALPITSS